MCVGFLRGIKLSLIKRKVGPGIQRVQVIPEGSMEPGIPSEVLTNGNFCDDRNVLHLCSPIW